jgi:hypothetical protein
MHKHLYQIEGYRGNPLAAQQLAKADPPTLHSRLTRRVAAEARWAGQAAQLPKLSINFDGCRSGR